MKAKGKQKESYNSSFDFCDIQHCDIYTYVLKRIVATCSLMTYTNKPAGNVKINK